MRYLKDLLFTDKFLVKGHANTGGRRLSTFLNNTRKRFLEMEEATLIKHEGGDRIHADWMLVRLDEILLAYEMEETGDQILKHLAEQKRDETEVTAHFSGGTSIDVSGKVRKQAISSNALRDHGFIVVVEPTFRGLPAQTKREYSVLEKLPYVIVNKNRAAFILLHPGGWDLQSR